MVDVRQFRAEEQVGLVVAIVLHALLAAVFLLQPVREETFKMPERMTVSLATEVGLESTAPDPVVESRAAIAPVLSDAPAPVSDAIASDVAPLPQPIPTQRAEPQPRPTRQAQNTQPRRRPDARRTSAPTPRRTTAPKPPPKPEPTRAARGGGSQIGDDFLGGSGSSTTTSETRVPANRIGASAQASLRSAINRQLKPHWDAPSGVDSDKLVTVLAFQLNENGSLKGRPRVVRQSGINASNRPQAKLHAQRAIRAVQLAAPFDLPDQYYNGWKNIKSWRFDRRL